MFIVVIHGWQDATTELAQTLGTALGVTAYEARQRLICGEPAVVACVGDSQHALTLAARITERGLSAFALDTAAGLSRAEAFPVRRFVLAGNQAIQIETAQGKGLEIPFEEVDLLVHASRISSRTEVEETTDRKFSLGRAALSGGLLVTKKVSRLEEKMTQDREEVLYLYAGKGPQVVFAKDGVRFEGLGPALRPTKAMNFAYLVTELRSSSQEAVYDDRLLRRAGQVKLLGPALNPEANLSLAVEILARCLRSD